MGASSLAGFRSGDRGVLDRLYRQHVTALRRYVRSQLRRAHPAGAGVDDATVDDVLQDVFARAFSREARRTFDGIRGFEPYLVAIARNRIRDWRRVLLREVPCSTEEVLAAEPAQRETNDDCMDPSLIWMAREYVMNLPPELRRVHAERYERGATQAEAAARLGISRQTLRTLEGRLRGGLHGVLVAAEVLPRRRATGFPRDGRRRRATT